MAGLPEDRLASNQPPFTNVGGNYFGPFLVKRGRSIIKRIGTFKSWLQIMNLKENRIPKYTLVCYDSLNNSCPKQLYSVNNSLIIYIIMCIIIVVTVCGNLLVVITISHFKQLHTPTNYLILSLALVDLLLGGCLMPPLMARIAESCWYFGEFFYRYFAVCHPLRYKNIVTDLVTFIFIVFTWVLSTVLGFVIMFLELNIKGIEDEYINTKCVGSCYLMQNEISGLSSSLFSFYIPGIVMICIYIKIFSVASRQARAIRDVGHQCHEEQKKRAASNRRETKAAKTLAIVMGVFIVCWVPYFLCNIIDPLINHVMSPLLIELLFWFGYMNSTFNPLVYGFFYSWFRKALKLIATGKIFQNNSSRTKLISD
ncbi:trace amine-associated receptor 1-like [Polypterus senegalus]|uniref:trace amine-associated receptor 1-like n=1 Tax=Polypterus senegalus TaxID=55291 RepID=UPI0019635874|nr:trace amine-associated receptor 1-like [Polypterus senegalus]